MLKKALNRVNPTGGLVYVCGGGGEGGGRGDGGWGVKAEEGESPTPFITSILRASVSPRNRL